MSVHTRSQRLAQATFPRIQDRRTRMSEQQFEKYSRFAKKFPALIHTCGLAQSVSFALAKKENEFVDDLAAVLEASGHPEVSSTSALQQQTHNLPLGSYLRLSRDAISAAAWLKRYVAAVQEDS